MKAWYFQFQLNKVVNVVEREIMYRDDVVLVIGLGMSSIIGSLVLELVFINIMFFNKPGIDGYMRHQNLTRNYLKKLLSKP